MWRKTRPSQLPEAGDRHDPRARPHGAARPLEPGERLLTDLAPDGFARLTVALSRHYFEAFATPESQAWLRAHDLAERLHGPEEAGRLCHALLGLLMCLRQERSGTFRFASPDCPCCAAILTPNEALLAGMIDALRRGRNEAARAAAFLLCEGADPERLLQAARNYARDLAPPLG